MRLFLGILICVIEDCADSAEMYLVPVEPAAALVELEAELVGLAVALVELVPVLAEPAAALAVIVGSLSVAEDLLVEQLAVLAAIAAYSHCLVPAVKLALLAVKLVVLLARVVDFVVTLNKCLQ
jgi:hypothetical protein